MKHLAVFLALVLVGCGIFPQKVAMEDPRIQPLLKAAATFDRISYGFTPIPKSADVRWESKSTNMYDAMLHIDSKTVRTIAFRRTNNGYRWIGDQEIFQGPKEFKTVDGIFHEEICLTYDIENISGFPTNRLNITYRGEDLRLADFSNLTLDKVKPILKEWGF